MGFRSDGPGNSRALAAAGRTERGGERGCSPEFAKSGTPGVKLTGAWVKEDQQDMENTSGHLGRAVWDRTWLATVRGGNGLPASCVHAVLALLRA